MAVHGARQKIHEAVSSWPRWISGSGLIDLMEKLIQRGWPGVTAHPHHVLPDSGWISFYLNEPANVEQAIALLRQSFELAEKQWAHKHAGE